MKVHQEINKKGSHLTAITGGANQDLPRVKGAKVMFHEPSSLTPWSYHPTETHVQYRRYQTIRVSVTYLGAEAVLVRH